MWWELADSCHAILCGSGKETVMTWMTIKDASEILNCSEKTIRRKIKSDEYEVKEERIGCGKPTIFIKLDIDSKLDKTENQTGQVKLDISSGHSKIKLDKLENQIGQAESNDNVENNTKRSKPFKESKNQTGQVKLDIDSKLDKTENQTGQVKLDIDSKLDISSGYSEKDINFLQITPDEKAVEVYTSHLPAISSPDLTPAKNLSDYEIKIAQFKLALIERVIDQSQRGSSKLQSIKNTLLLYNTGTILNEIFTELGEVSERTLYRWQKQYIDSGCKLHALAPMYSSKIKGRKVPGYIQQIIISLIMHPNEISTATAINNAILYCQEHRLEIPCSIRTIQRWAEDWIDQHKAEYILKRKGEKYFSEKYNKTILRDQSILKVGDVWVLDGHTLEIMIIDPRDSKAKKFSLICFFDWASRMPVGCALSLTESTSSTALALRNGLLMTKYRPRIVYSDNGRAFRSKFFMGEKNTDDFEENIKGAFARLNIDVQFALPYNAKAKVIERFFNTLQETLEKLYPGYTGNNAINKPANLMRNEKWAKRNTPHQAITTEQFYAGFEYWAKNIYGITPHSGIEDAKPLEVFEEGSKEIAKMRYISESDLNHLMLCQEHKKVQNQGIKINTLWYWDANLVRHVGKEVKVFWDYFDLRTIVIHDQYDRFICQAKMRTYQHPMIKLAVDQPLAQAELTREIKEIKKITKMHKESADALAKRSSDSIDDLMNLPNVKQALFCDTPLIPEYKKQKTTEEMAMEMINKTEIKETPKAETKKDKESGKINREELENLQRIVGIK